MKVFLSWSGERSKYMAEVLSEWLPDVIQSVRPFMSKRDIEAGAEWSAKIGGELAESNFGIACLTPENREAPWIMFEAGALAKQIGIAHVVPYLIDMEKAGIGSTPLSRFQAKEAASEAETKDLVSAINRAFKEPPLTEKQLDRVFETYWPKLREGLAKLPVPPKDAPKPPDLPEMVKEILLSVRVLEGRLLTTSPVGL